MTGCSMKRDEGPMVKTTTSGDEIAMASSLPDATRPKDSKLSIWRRILPLAALILALTAFLALDLDRFMTIEALRNNRAVLSQWVESNYYLTLALFILAYAAATAISIPGASILTIFGGFLFGLWAGTLAVIVAATAGAFIVYLVANSSVGSSFRSRASGLLARMKAGFRDNELSYMFLLRLVPVFPFWAVNIAAGLFSVKPRTFLLATFFGMIPGSFVYVSVGNGVGAIFDAGGDVTLSGMFLQPQILLPILGLSALAAAPILLKLRRQDRTAETASLAQTEHDSK